MPGTYRTFGLNIQSDFTFEKLEGGVASDAEVDLRFVRAHGIKRQGKHPVDPYFDVQPDTQYMHWRDVGAFLITGPDQVLVEPGDGVSDHLVSQASLGLVMSLVLERHKLLCLHASAVSVDGRAVVFLGDKGAGKSTTCGAMLAQGHLPISDDLVPIEPAADGSGAQMIRPGFSSMKLYPDSAAALKLAPQKTDRQIHPSTSKMQKRMPVPIPQQPVPAGALFVLRRTKGTTCPAYTRLPPHEALQQVLRYTFMARYGETRLGREHLILHMRRCSALVAQVPVYDLTIPPDLAKLDELAEAIAQATRTSCHEGAVLSG